MEHTLMKKETLPAPSTWTAMKEQAQVLLKSGFLPPSIKTPEQALSIALAGRELGIGFMESIRSINIIQGKPTISPQLMLALANRRGEVEDLKIEEHADKVTVTIVRKGRSAHTSEFGVKEATAMNLIGKDNYRKQPKTMFQWRALAANLRVTFPDVVLGLYTPEEMGAEVTVGDQGEMEVVSPEFQETSIPAEIIPENPTAAATEEIPQELPKAAASEQAVTEQTAVEQILDKVSAKGTHYWIIVDREGVRYKCWNSTTAAYAMKMKDEKRPVLITSVSGKYGLEIKFMVAAYADAN